MNDRSVNVSDQTKTIEAVFKFAIHAEQQAAEFYRMLAEGFTHVSGLPAFWRGLMEDEVKHAEALEKICGSLTSDQLMLPADGLLLERARGVQKTLDGIQSIQTLEDAYITAHALENSEVNALFVLLTLRFVSKEDRRKFYQSEIQYHQAKLQVFSQTFGSSAWRKGISIRRPEHT